jgi:hypothetical protein
VSIWDRAARWSARRWLRRLDARLNAGHIAARHDPAIAEALDRHIRVVRAQVVADVHLRAGLVSAPPLVLLAIYAEEVHHEAKLAGWEPPPMWTSNDNLSLRLLACCVVAKDRRVSRALR